MNKFVYVLLLGGILIVYGCKGTKSSPQKIIKKDIINANTLASKKFVPTADRLLYEKPDGIKKIQTILYLNNYRTGKINGEMTAETLQALAAFQKDNRIKVGDRSTITIDALGVKLMDFDVETLQEALQKKGVDVGKIDGILGPKTRIAYQTFLHRNSLSGLRFSKQIKAVLMDGFFVKETTEKKENRDSATTPKANPELLSEGTPTSTIKNMDVQRIQEALRRKGYDPGNVNGIFSMPTQDALFRYQVDNKLPIGGFNEETMRALGL